MGFKLTVEDGSYVQTLEVRSGALTVGKNPPAGLALTSPGLSSRHAIFRLEGDRVEMRALPTRLGVRFNGERVEHAMLRPGDTVHVGWARVTVLEILPETPTGNVTAPVPESQTSAPLAFADEPAAGPDVASASSFATLSAGGAVATTTTAAAAQTRPVAGTHPVEEQADFVVLSRRAARMLPWYAISIALHAVAFAALLLLPKTTTAPTHDDGVISVTLRQEPARVDPIDVPPIEPSRPRVDLARPDLDVVPDSPLDSNARPSSDPRGSSGTAPVRADDPGNLLDDGGAPWATPAGSVAIGSGRSGTFGAGVATALDETFGKGDADKANAAAAGRLAGEPFTRALVNGLRLRTNETNVKVVPGDYDHGERVMETLGLKHGLLTADEIAGAPIGRDVRALFFNCTGKQPTRPALDNLARWVDAGGWLFTSDWCVDLVLDRAFTGFVKPLHDGPRTVMTPDETITFTVAPGSHVLLQGLPASEQTSRWWLEDSSIPFTIEKPAEVEVLAQSADLERKHGSRFVAVTFRYGRGRVVHALGHMFQKEGNLRGAYAMQRLLLNFLYQAIRKP